MEGEQREPRRTRSTVSRPPIDQAREEPQQNTPMTNNEDRFHATLLHNYDLRHWPSGMASEEPFKSPVRNYILYDTPPYKTELPGELRTVQLYFDTQYTALARPKLLHVHIGTGETLLSELIPATRRLWSKWLREWLAVVHHTLVRFGDDDTIEPHPDDTFYPRPRGPSHVWGSDFPGLRPCPRVSSPNRDDILGDHFKNLRKEKDQRRQKMRDRHQEQKGETSDEGSGPLGGNTERSVPDSRKKKFNKDKKKRLKKALAKRQAASEEASESTGGEVDSNVENQGTNSSAPIHSQDVQHNAPVHPSGSYITPAVRTPLSEIRERRTNSRSPATGVNTLPLLERPTVPPVTPINGGTNTHANVNTVPLLERPTVSPITPINGGTNSHANSSYANTANGNNAYGNDNFGNNSHGSNSYGTNAYTSNPVTNEQQSPISHGYEPQYMDEGKPDINIYDELDMAEDE